MTSSTRADLGVGSEGPSPPTPSFCPGVFFPLIFQQSRNLRPECTRLHLRELQSQNFSRRSMRPKLPSKVRRAQSWCHWILNLKAPSITKSSARPCSKYCGQCSNRTESSEFSLCKLLICCVVIELTKRRAKKNQVLPSSGLIPKNL